MILLGIYYHQIKFAAWYDEKNNLFYIHEDDLKNAKQLSAGDVDFTLNGNQFAIFSQKKPFHLNPYITMTDVKFQGYKKNEADNKFETAMLPDELQPHLAKLGSIFCHQPAAIEVTAPRKPLHDSDDDVAREAATTLSQGGEKPAKTQHNWFVRAALTLKLRTWDRLPTWGKVIVGGLLVIGTLVGLGAIAFGTMGLVAPAALGIALGALHLAGLSFPFAAFIGAIVGGAVATFLFGAVPATTAITAKAVAKPAASDAPVISKEDEASCSDKLKGLFSSCGSYDEEDEDSHDVDSQKRTCCTFGAKEASKANAADTSCLSRMSDCCKDKHQYKFGPIINV